MGKKVIVKSKETFVNPYVFVPLEKNCSKNYNFENLKNEKDLLTGWIECTLLTKSPIFIPNTSNENRFNLETDKGEQIRSLEFYSNEDPQKISDANPLPPKNPVIPSSELRGMIRSSFELLTNSCLSAIDHEKKLYKRVTKPGYPGKVIHTNDGRWKIIPCIKYKMDRTKYKQVISNLEEGQEIRFRANPNRYFTGFDDNGIKGYFHHGEYINRKSNESIFVENPNKQQIDIEENTVENLLVNFKLYNDKKVNLAFKKKEHTGYRRIKANKINDLDGALVYYKSYNSKIYLNLAEIGREVFYSNLTTIIKDYVPCSSLKQLCPACILFGFTSKNDQLASRVRFTPAISTKEFSAEDYFVPEVLKELASPKLSSTEFYLLKPSQEDGIKAQIWNYDYAGFYKKDLVPFRRYKAEISGRKFYWHHKINEIPRTLERSDRNVGIRALRSNNNFIFKVYFNNVKEEELKKLIWTLEIGNNEENAHKIGMGKPLGLGSVKIIVDNIKVRKISLYDDAINYEIVDSATIRDETRTFQNADAAELLGCDPKVLSMYMKITNFEKAPSNVEYPSNVGSDLNYEWFMSNRAISPGSPFKHIIHQSIPTDLNNPKLFKYDKEFRQNQNKNRKRRY